MPRITVSRPPGRPKDTTKRAAIVEAAKRLFEAGAYESVTMEQVASAAGVAKMTVYSHFLDKESLFEAMVQSTSDTLVAALPARPGRDGDLEDELVQFGCVFLEVLLSRGVLHSMHRHIDQFSRNPALAERFYNAGPGRTRATLAAWLASGATGRRLSKAEAVEAASDLMSLWLGDLPIRLVLGLQRPLSRNAVAQRVRRCARLIIGAHSLSGAAGARPRRDLGGSRMA